MTQLPYTTEKRMYDKEFRQRLIQNPRKVVKELNYQEIDESVQINVIKNSKNTIHLVMYDSNGDEALDIQSIRAAGISSSISTAGTAGTASLTVSCASSAGTLGTVF
ncbi:hypothetical protein SPONN_2810 [uncultured Candidatus Thioglobus sp.]|nr:hypothetical protein SPONN_2810 [uncultured Candidatus Thioglobus sp.]SMM99477.1 hypothetical protein SPONL_611 [uncultured Candidatus Thioglobus sp.]